MDGGAGDADDGGEEETGSDAPTVMPTGLDCGMGMKLAESDRMLYGLAADGQHVYWIEQTIGMFSAITTKVLRVPVAGGAPAMVVPQSETIASIAVDDTNLYWFEQTGSAADPRKIHRGPKAGGGTDDVIATGRFFSPIALDATSVYFGQVGAMNTYAFSRVAKTAAAGATPEIVCSGNGISTGASTGFTILGDKVYWGYQVRIFTASLTAAANQTCTFALADPITNLDSMAGDGADIFYTGDYMGTRKLYRRAAAGGMSATLSGVANGHPVVARGGKIYFASPANELVRMNADGTGQAALTSFSPNLTSITTDDANLFYAVGNGAGNATAICKIAR
jgi:hypothetical protein